MKLIKQANQAYVNIKEKSRNFALRMVFFFVCAFGVHELANLKVKKS